jgi:flagellar motility protein MotE (MotC chaperone)
MMNKVKEHIAIFLAMFVSLAALMTLLAMIEPRAFTLVPGTVPDSLLYIGGDSTAVADPISHAANAGKEHLDRQTEQVHNEVKDLPLVVDKKKEERRDSIAVVSSVDDGFKLPKGPPLGPDTLAESERKKMVQIFESMEPESAAKILLNMSDAAVKQVLTTMKKRQSARILAVLEPAQAARILKEKL